MKPIRSIPAVVIAFGLVFGASACSSEKKVGSAIDVEKLAEKNQALGGLKETSKDKTGGFVGETEQKQQQQAQQQAAQNQAAQQAEVKKQKEASAVSFSITASGYDPYVIRVFVGGVISVTNRFTKAATVTADRGEFDSGPIAPGDTWTYEPKTAGKFNFHDDNRPFVVGSLEVLTQ